jgi:hypothetical protein
MPSHYPIRKRRWLNDEKVFPRHYGNIYPMMRTRIMTNNAIIDSELRQETVFPRALYYPSKDSSDLQLQAYATACFNSVLLHSEEIPLIFDFMVQMWRLPDYQKLMRIYHKRLPETREWYRQCAQAIRKNCPRPNFPAVCIEDVKAVLKDFQPTQMIKCLDTIIKLGFNRESDLENHILKIRPETSPYLVEAIFSASIMYHLTTSGMDSKQDKVLTEEELKQLRRFSSLLESDPTNRAGMKTKHAIIRTLKGTGFTLCHNEKIGEYAEQWYKSRIEPGTIEAYVDELAKSGVILDRGRIGNNIAICDQATGYPRKWRK